MPFIRRGRGVGVLVAKGGQSALYIETLGDFRVSRGKRVLTRDAGRAYRLWELFKYLLITGGQGVHPEVLAATLWPGRDYQDPKAVVRTSIYRLRQLINTNDNDVEGNYIIFKQGCYQWNTEANYWYDAQEFEDLNRQAHSIGQGDPAQTIALLKRSLSLYKGEYLPEEAYTEWAISQRHYYRRLYLEAVVTLVPLLKKDGRYREIIEHLEEAIRIEPFEEELHIPFLEALLDTGRWEQALTHYQYITAALYRELGIKPSPAMRRIYELLQSQKQGAAAGDGQAKDRLEDSMVEDGAFFCDPHVFRSIYKLEQRRGERRGQDVALGVLTLTSRIPRSLSELLPAMAHLEKVLLACLRKGDVISRWNDSQFLLLLDAINPHQVQKVFRRIESSFWGTYGQEDRLQLQSEQPQGRFL